MNVYIRVCVCVCISMYVNDEYLMTNGYKLIEFSGSDTERWLEADEGYLRQLRKARLYCANGTDRRIGLLASH